MIRTGKRQAQLTIWSQKQLHSAAAAALNQRFQQQQLVLIKTPKLYCTSHQSVPAPNDQLQPPSTPRSRRRVCVIDAWVDRRRGIIISACLYVLTAPHLSARPQIPPHEPSCPPAPQSSTPFPPLLAFKFNNTFTNLPLSLSSYIEPQTRQNYGLFPKELAKIS